MIKRREESEKYLSGILLKKPHWLTRFGISLITLFLILLLAFESNFSYRRIEAKIFQIPEFNFRFIINTADKEKIFVKEDQLIYPGELLFSNYDHKVCLELSRLKNNMLHVIKGSQVISDGVDISIIGEKIPELKTFLNEIAGAKMILSDAYSIPADLRKINDVNREIPIKDSIEEDIIKTAAKMIIHKITQLENSNIIYSPVSGRVNFILEKKESDNKKITVTVLPVAKNKLCFYTKIKNEDYLNIKKSRTRCYFNGSNNAYTYLEEILLMENILKSDSVNVVIKIGTPVDSSFRKSVNAQFVFHNKGLLEELYSTITQIGVLRK